MEKRLNIHTIFKLATINFNISVMSLDKNDTTMKIKLSEIPLESSLGLLALGDVAFTAWREIKKANNIHPHNNTKE